MKSVLIFATAVAGVAFAAEGIHVPFSDPSRPGHVVVSTLNGSVSVKAGPPGGVIVEARGDDGDRHRAAEKEGLHRIPMGHGLNIEEAENTVNINSGPPGGDTDIVVSVPQGTSVKVTAISGSIDVEGVSGDLDVNTTNGKAKLTNVSGSAVVHSLNGGVVADFVRVQPEKAMSFSSLNGNIDVTLPADVKARVKLKSDNGEVYTDFDVQVDSTPQKPVEETEHGRHRIRIDKTVYGTINGGGPEMMFTTFNGSIYIRKRK